MSKQLQAKILIEKDGMEPEKKLLELAHLVLKGAAKHCDLENIPNEYEW